MGKTREKIGEAKDKYGKWTLGERYDPMNNFEYIIRSFYKVFDLLAEALSGDEPEKDLFFLNFCPLRFIANPDKIEISEEHRKHIEKLCLGKKIVEQVDNLLTPEPAPEELKVGDKVEFKLFYPVADELKTLTGEVDKIKQVAVIRYKKSNGEETLQELEIKSDRIKLIRKRKERE